jgi:hypothetical protein
MKTGKQRPTQRRPLDFSNMDAQGRGDGSRRPCLHGQRRNQPQLLLGRPAGRLNGQAVQHRGDVPRERRAIGPRRQVALLHGPLVNQGTFALAGAALVDVVAEQAGASARFAGVSTDPGAFSQNSWIAAMKAQMQAKYPKMQLVDIRYGLGKPAESFSVAQDLINKFRGQLDAIVAPTVVALPRVAEAVEQAGLTGKIVVTGMPHPRT